MAIIAEKSRDELPPQVRPHRHRRCRHVFSFILFPQLRTRRSRQKPLRVLALGFAEPFAQHVKVMIGLARHFLARAPYFRNNRVLMDLLSASSSHIAAPLAYR
jgi:hypothetical protein